MYKSRERKKTQNTNVDWLKTSKSIQRSKTVGPNNVAYIINRLWSVKKFQPKAWRETSINQSINQVYICLLHYQNTHGNRNVLYYRHRIHFFAFQTGFFFSKIYSRHKDSLLINICTVGSVHAVAKPIANKNLC